MGHDEEERAEAGSGDRGGGCPHEKDGCEDGACLDCTCEDSGRDGDAARPVEAEAVGGEYRVSLAVKCDGCGAISPLYNPIAVVQGMQGQVVRAMCACGKIIVAQPAERIQVPDTQMVKAALGTRANQTPSPLIVKP